jgi:hypothetical protein
MLHRLCSVVGTREPEITSDLITDYFLLPLGLMQAAGERL